MLTFFVFGKLTGRLECAGIEYAPFVEEHAKFPSLQFWLYAGAAIVLVLFAGSYSCSCACACSC
jgi:hypothetical protein